MRTVPFSEAKATLSALVDAVEGGETINITRHGKTVARLVRPEDDARARRETAAEELRRWRRTLPPTNMTIEDILSARDEGRK